MSTQASLKATRNRILAALSAEDVRLLQPHLVRVQPPAQAGPRGAQPSDRACLFHRAWACFSIISIGSKNLGLEVGLIGRDGMTGIAIVLGSDRSPNETFIQIAGSGFRTSRDDLQVALHDPEKWEPVFRKDHASKKSMILEKWESVLAKRSCSNKKGEALSRFDLTRKRSSRASL
jgi:hypothetical protein